MELDDKKWLARKLGFKYECGCDGPGDRPEWIKTNKGVVYFLNCPDNDENWNPDTNPEHFNEVWDHLTETQKLESLGYCVKEGREHPIVPLGHVLTAIAKYRDLVELMHSVLKTLKH